MTKINKKIENLEDKIYDKFRWGSTTIDPECLIETEKQLFLHLYKMFRLNETEPISMNNMRARNNLVNKSIYYNIRRGVDLFMKSMSIQLDSCEKFLFWTRFIDFVSETMFILSRNRGSDFIAHFILGENPDYWPNDDDPKWEELKEADNKWNRDFRELWDNSSLTMEKIFCVMRDNLEERASEEEFEIEETTSPDKFENYNYLAEIISLGLSCPSKFDIINLVVLSLISKKTLLETLNTVQ